MGRLKLSEKEYIIKQAALNTIKANNDKLPALYDLKWKLEKELDEVNRAINEIAEHVQKIGNNPNIVLGEE